jgi:hypothetical protein
MAIGLTGTKLWLLKFHGLHGACTCLVRQGAPGASAVRHREAGKCAKTKIYDLSILMKEDGVLGFWGIQPRELLPGEAPTQPLDSNWIYLIKDETTR